MTKSTSDRQDTQKAAFIRTARELGCDEDPKAFKRALRKIVKPGRKGDSASPQEHKDTA